MIVLTMNDIIREEHETLREIAKEVTIPLSDEDKKIGEQLLEYVKNSQDEEIAEKHGLRPGVGLAAPQINVSKRIIAVHTADENDELFSHILFNPKIISHSVEKTFLPNGEGCLSIDREIPGYVPRYSRITVRATNIKGEEIKLRLSGFNAIVCQHEIDHLNGILFFDHINKENPLEIPDNAQSLY